jgi:hypothetical protein
MLNPKTLKNATLEELNQAYVDAAIQYANIEPTSEGLKVSKKAVQLASSVVKELHARGEASATFIKLLRHSEPVVRFWAATELFKERLDLAKPVLEDLAAHEPGEIGFKAEWVLKYGR